MTFLGLADAVMDVGDVGTALDLDSDNIAVVIGGHLFTDDDVRIGGEFNENLSPRGVLNFDASGLGAHRRVVDDVRDGFENPDDTGDALLHIGATPQLRPNRQQCEVVYEFPADSQRPDAFQKHGGAPGKRRTEVGK